MSPTARMTAEERRDDIVAAASKEFARAGFAGTSTDVIAHRVGVSQPYLFQLFGTKKDLFLAAVRSCFDRTRRVFEESGRGALERGLAPQQVLEEMGHAYVRLLMDRDALRLQLQAYAACGDPDVRAVVRENFSRLWQTVQGLSGASNEELHGWFAQGMLLNVVASLTDAATLEEFDAVICGDWTTSLA